MKAGLFALAGLVSVAAAQPHRRHQQLHEKRQAVVVDVVTQVVTASAPDVVVYVNEDGVPVSTSYVNAPAPTAAPAPVVNVNVAAPVVQSSAAAPAPAPTSSAAPAPAAPAPAQSSAAAPVVQAIQVSVAAPAPAASSAAPAPSSDNEGLSISYSPYNADGTCKSASQVSHDFANLNGYSMVRIYGTDCNQLNTVGSAAIAAGMKIFGGVFDITQTAADIAQIIAFGNLEHFHTISIGNELVNAGAATVGEVVAAVGLARTLLKAAGYQGKVVTVDTWNAMVANPALCQASDYAAANAHAFYNSDITASGAGGLIASYAQQVKNACGGMDTMITESGWPSQGSANGAAVPSPANQQAAISSLKAAFPNGNLILFNAYNDLWKTNDAATFGAEQWWGIYGTSTA